MFIQLQILKKHIIMIYDDHTLYNMNLIFKETYYAHFLNSNYLFKNMKYEILLKFFNFQNYKDTGSKFEQRL